jgi:hypothetical protein
MCTQPRRLPSADPDPDQRLVVRVVEVALLTIPLKISSETTRMSGDPTASFSASFSFGASSSAGASDALGRASLSGRYAGWPG